MCLAWECVPAKAVVRVPKGLGLQSGQSSIISILSWLQQLKYQASFGTLTCFVVVINLRVKLEVGTSVYWPGLVWKSTVTRYFRTASLGALSNQKGHESVTMCITHWSSFLYRSPHNSKVKCLNSTFYGERDCRTKNSLSELNRRL